MTYTTDQRDALKAAIARGVTEVQMGAERVKYASLADMRKTLALIEEELRGDAAVSSRVHYPAWSKGLR